LKTTTQRRTFLRQGLAGGAALGLGPHLIGQTPKSGRKYRTALIGSGWWGMNILRVALADGRCDVVALCDVDADALEISGDEIESLTGKAPALFASHEELLVKAEAEVVIISTPDHWHALQTIDAVRAGAHVFVEKPTGHTVGESRAMVTAARDAGRVVQVGLHRRIGPHHVSGQQFLKSGKVGDIGMVKSFVTGGGGTESPTPNAEPPKGLDWDRYCGPAPLRPFNRKIHPGGFRNFLDFANGTLGDWGVHWLDQVLLWTDEKYPKKVFSHGGRPVRGEAILNAREQTSDAPDHQVAVYEFEDFAATWEHRRFGGDGSEKSKFGCYFYGSKGTFHMGWRDGWTFYPTKGEPIHEEAKFDNQKDGHNLPPLWADFLDAIEEKRLPVADIEAAHLSSNLSMLGMVSYKVGRSIEWDGAQEKILGDDEAHRLLRREYRGDWEYPA